MKKSQISSAILIALFVFTINIDIYPKVTAPPPPPTPTGYIADIFPRNNNTSIHLLSARTIITINATDFLNEIGIILNGTYTLFNPEIPTNLTINLPFWLRLDVENAIFGVSVNDTQVPFEIATATEENLTSMGIDPEFTFPFYLHPTITLITSNLTLLENNTYVVKYQFDGIIPSMSTRVLFYMLYSSYTTKFWKGNATERVEYIAYGGSPNFHPRVFSEGLRQELDIVGGKWFICEWDNAQSNNFHIEIIFDISTYELPFIGIDMIVLNVVVYVAIAAVIVLRIRKRKRKQFLEDMRTS